MRFDIPAAFRRLCVETLMNQKMKQNIEPAAFRRLCVETLSNVLILILAQPSRL